ncbi:MAG: sulfatase-like hydrolase/transferase, partial [Thermoanaerobaculia bacterium]
MSGSTSGWLGAGGLGLATGLLWFLLEMTARFAWGGVWAGDRPPADYLLCLAYYSLAGFAAGVAVFLLLRIAARSQWARNVTARTAAALGLVLVSLLTVLILRMASRSGIDLRVALRYLGAALLVCPALALGAWGLARWKKRYGIRRLLAYGGGPAALLLISHLVLVRATALERLLDRSAAPSPATGHPNVLLVTIDTLRADRLHSYGYPREISPNMDRLAREGALFEQAVAHSPWTQPSFATILTSTYPSQHGSFVLLAPPTAGDEEKTETILYQSFLREDAVTLAELFLEQGYRTLAVQPLCIDEDVLRFDQGFQVYLCESQFVSSTWRKSLLGLGIEGIGRWLGHRGSRRSQGDLAPADEVYRSLRALISHALPQ